MSSRPQLVELRLARARASLVEARARVGRGQVFAGRSIAVDAIEQLELVVLHLALEARRR